jgi:ArsR family transcriptional regulator
VLIPKLLSHFSSVVVVDVAEEMLRLAAQSIPEGLNDRVSIIHGDSGSARSAGVLADTIICTMVLHHVPSPADIFRDSAAMLKPEGSLIVADLCRHEQTWAIERCGDMWLGFDPIELTGFAERVGLIEKENVYFGLRNGFQIQVRRFVAPSSETRLILDNR